jgi:hypothetical protein
VLGEEFEQMVRDVLNLHQVNYMDTTFMELLHCGCGAPLPEGLIPHQAAMITNAFAEWGLSCAGYASV